MDPKMYPVAAGYVPNNFRDYPQAANGSKNQAKTADYSLTAADSGVVTYVTADGKVVTLPATVVGMTFIIVNGCEDGQGGISISPQAADKIQGAGLTAADNKDLVSAKATARKGDFVKLVADGVDGYFVQEIRGTWAREA
jgi:hypothetical protein